LFEVLQDFPGVDDDLLLDTESAPSAYLRTLGNLHLLLGSPAQFWSAIERKNAVIDAVRKGRVVYDDRSRDAVDVRHALGL